jgi:hypothetical protein
MDACGVKTVLPGKRCTTSARQIIQRPKRSADDRMSGRMHGCRNGFI